MFCDWYLISSCSQNQRLNHIVTVFYRPLTDFNEVTFHYLECMYVHVYCTKLQVCKILPCFLWILEYTVWFYLLIYMLLQPANVSTDAQMISSVNGTPFRGHQGIQQNQVYFVVTKKSDLLWFLCLVLIFFFFFCSVSWTVWWIKGRWPNGDGVSAATC